MSTCTDLVVVQHKQCDMTGKTMKWYSYHNLDLSYGACTLYVWNGSISFRQPDGAATPWHGSPVEEAMGDT